MATLLDCGNACRLTQQLSGTSDTDCQSLVAIASSFAEDVRQLQHKHSIERKDLLAACDRCALLHLACSLCVLTASGSCVSALRPVLLKR